MGKKTRLKEEVVIELKIKLVDGHKVEANLKHHCASTDDALNMIKEFITRMKRRKTDA